MGGYSTGPGSVTFVDAASTFVDDVDTTKKLAFQLSSITTATTRTATWPDVTGTVYIEGQTIDDANANELIKFTATAAAVNEITITNAATGDAPLLETTGGDAAISLDLRAKGSGSLRLQTNSANRLIVSDNPVSMFTFSGNQVFDTGAAVAAASYTVGRDADGTNQLHLHVPTGAGIEMSVNDVAQAVLTSTALTLTNPLPLGSGGTAASLTASDGGIFYSTASAAAILAGTATANSVLVS